MEIIDDLDKKQFFYCDDCKCLFGVDLRKKGMTGIGNRVQKTFFQDLWQRRVWIKALTRVNWVKWSCGYYLSGRNKSMFSCQWTLSRKGRKYCSERKKEELLEWCLSEYKGGREASAGKKGSALGKNKDFSIIGNRQWGIINNEK